MVIVLSRSCRQRNTVSQCFRLFLYCKRPELALRSFSTNVRMSEFPNIRLKRAFSNNVSTVIAVHHAHIRTLGRACNSHCLPSAMADDSAQTRHIGLALSLLAMLSRLRTTPLPLFFRPCRKAGYGLMRDRVVLKN